MASIFNQHGVPHPTTQNAGPRVSLHLAAPHLGSAFHQNGIPRLGSPNACLPYPFGLVKLSVSPVAWDNEGYDPCEVDCSRAASRPQAIKFLGNVEDRKENDGKLRPSVQHPDCLEGPPGIATNASVVAICDGLECEPVEVVLPSSPTAISVDDFGDGTFVGLKDNLRTWTPDDSDVERVHRYSPPAEILLPSPNPSSLKSSLDENSIALSATSFSIGSFDNKASAFPFSKSPSLSLSSPSTIVEASRRTSHASNGLKLDHNNRLDALALRSPATYRTTEGSCNKHYSGTTSNPNTSLQVWSMPEEDDVGYLDNFLKHHFFSQAASSTTWVLDQKKYTEPVVLHNVTKPGQVFGKSRKIPGLKACSAGAGDQSVVVLGWDNLAVWRRASTVSVSSYSKSSCMYILETARKFELAIYSYLAGLGQKNPTEDLKHFHGTYLVHCSLSWRDWGNHSVKNWEICGDIRTIMTMTIGFGPVPGLLAGTVKFAGVEWTMLMARQAIMIRAYLEGTDWSTIPIIDYGPHYAKLAYHMADSAGKESDGFFYSH